MTMALFVIPNEVSLPACPPALRFRLHFVSADGSAGRSDRHISTPFYVCRSLHRASEGDRKRIEE